MTLAFTLSTMPQNTQNLLQPGTKRLTHPPHLIGNPSKSACLLEQLEIRRRETLMADDTQRIPQENFRSILAMRMRQECLDVFHPS